MARKQRNLAKTAAALVATALLEKAIQKAAEDPRIRRKAKALAEALVKRAQAAGKKKFPIRISAGPADSTAYST